MNSAHLHSNQHLISELVAKGKMLWELAMGLGERGLKENSRMFQPDENLYTTCTYSTKRLPEQIVDFKSTAKIGS